MTSRPPWFWLVLLIPLASLGGCTSLTDDKIAMRLENTTTSYRQSVRWGYWDAAVGFLHPDERSDIDPETLDNIRVTSYEVVQPPVIADDTTAVQLVRIEYVLNDRQRLESLADRQQWRYDDEMKAWWLYSGLPKFKLD
jgi:hypothetical protein